jgi:hypothetical protein
MAKGLYKNDPAVIDGQDGYACDEIAGVNARLDNQVVGNLAPALISDVIGVYQEL